MAINSSLFKSKVAQRVATLLILAAAIPALLVSGLTHRNMDRLINHYEQESLAENSKNYASNTLGNLLFARSTLQTDIFAHQNSQSNDDLLQRIVQTKNNRIPIFKSLLQLTYDGETLAQFADSPIASEVLATHKTQILGDALAQQTRVYLLTLPAKASSHPPHIFLAHPMPEARMLYIAEVNPAFLWGKADDYEDHIRLCVYQTVDSVKQPFFCSNKQADTSKVGTRFQPFVASRTLYLKPELLAPAWTFESTRITPSASNGLWDFYGENGYIWVVVLSLLIIGLLSLNQIRRTMVPLEHLIAGTRKIAKGQFDPVTIDGKSEFAELANAFNHMSSDIQRQLNTLQTLSEVDKKIVAHLNVDELIEQVIKRIQHLMPDCYLNFFRVTDSDSTEEDTNCLVNIAYGEIKYATHQPIPNLEISRLSLHPTGQRIKANDRYIFLQEIIKLGAQYVWVLPILWQGQISAFLVIGSQHELMADTAELNEIRDLSNRIGIAIAAQKREEQLLIQAHHDLLTGLPNRVLLDERIQQAIEHSQKTKLPAWVVFLDLDRFKYINDSMGHHLGDLVLIEVANRLKLATRASDTIARFGGDEFIIVLQGDADENAMTEVLKRVVDAIAKPFKINQLDLLLTCSVGVAIYPNDGINAVNLIQHADIAMYRAKELGKNNIQFFTEALNRKVADRLYTENLLRQALDKNELILHYQPKVNLKTMKIVGMEALIRWDSAELGFVPPTEFIHLAEETGLILPIGEWVIRTACEQAMHWKKAGYGEFLMSVNLSARQFNQTDLVASIKKTLTDTGLPPEYLELELTESVVMTEVSTSLKVLSEIKALGIKISVDDFGTGYSSLAYLQNLPLDTLKIDKSFTDNIVKHTDAAPIVQTIISLAKNLNLKIVAEGVESYEQVLYLQSRGCDEIQGYYFSRPQLAQNLEPLLRENLLPSPL